MNEPAETDTPPRAEAEEAARAAEAMALLVRATPRAWATPAYAALLVICFAASVVAGVDLLSPRSGQLLAAGAAHGPAIAEGEWWRLWSSSLLHVGAIHLAFNLWALWDAGRLVERIYGHAAFAALVLLCAPAASLLQVAVKPMVVGAGASGAIFGLYGALAAFAWTGHDAFPRELLRRQQRSLLGFLAYNLLFGLSVAGIGLAAHAGGFVAGVGAGLLLRRDLRAPERGAGRRLAAGLALACAVAGGAWALQAWLAERPEIRRVAAGARCEAAASAARAPGAGPDRVAAALQACDEAIAADGRSPFPRLMRIWLLATTGRTEEARRAAEEAIAVDPENTGARAFRAELLGQAGHPQDAEPDCSHLCRPSLQTSVCPAICAVAAAERGELRQALERAGLGLSHRPQEPRLFAFRASIRQRLGDLPGALADADQAVRLDPGGAVPLNGRAWIRVERREYALALADADQALAKAPDAAGPLGTRCFALAGLGRKEEARRDCARAVALHEQNVIDRAMLALLDGDRALAAKLWRQAEAARDPDAAALAPFLEKP